MTSKLKTLTETACTCDACKSMCMRPCWGTVEDIQKIIDAGFSNRLACDVFGNGDDKNIYIISPALKGSEGKKMAFNPKSEEGCTFWKDGLCELHNLGLKPSGGRLAYHDDKTEESEGSPSLHEEIAITWQEDAAKQLANRWCKENNVTPGDYDPIEVMLGGMQMMMDYITEGL